MKKHLTFALGAALLAGCASPAYNGGQLVPGQSSARDVEAQMGQPAERLAAAGGDAIWFYPRQPMGRQTYAVRLSPSGVVRSVAQVLTEENLRHLTPGVTTAAQARELLGPPWTTSRNERLQREVWTYAMFNATQWDYWLHVQMSPDGVVREVLLLKDYVKEMGDKN